MASKKKVTMEDLYPGDGTDHIACIKCGSCITCGDCDCDKNKPSIKKIPK